MAGQGVSIREMQNFAELGSDKDMMNVINLDSSAFDDIGLNLLTSTNVKTVPFSNAYNTISVEPSAKLPSDNISVSNLEPLNPISIDIPFSDLGDSSTVPEIKINRESAPKRGAVNTSATNIGNDNSNGNGNSPHVQFQPPLRMTMEQEAKEKSELLNKLHRLRTKGFQTSKMFTMDHSLDEIQQELNRLADTRNLENSIKFQRQIMVGMVTGMEMLNSKFNPLDWQLDGWSESVHENVEDFDEVFEELYDKYKGKGNMPPEVRLVFMLAGSGFMFHVSNTFFRDKMKDMNMSDILNSNPMLAKQMAAAAANTASPGFGRFMGAAMGVPEPVNSGANVGAPTGAFNQPNNMSGPAPVNMMPPAESGRGNLAASSQGTATASVGRREMKGPSGVDDILKTFEEIRRSEDTSRVAFINPSNQDFNAESAASFNDEVASQKSSVTGGTGAGASRGRKKKQPVLNGSTISLNV